MSTRVIIHDLGEAYNEILRKKCDEVIHADGNYAPCQGCFGCWTKHPAECHMKDRLHKVCRVVGKADELIIISENCYGSYSPAIKNVLDRSIGSSTPLSTYRGRQMHHTLRYGRHTSFSVFTYGEITEEEKLTFELLAARNALNDGYQESRVTVLKSLTELEDRLV